ncbi:MAG: hypothetical protein Q7R81_02680 [Candidatus Peregrinibacteria bacterium]|nr:hypothetical protein [Candidatus Peregrinibacteria bacterium]
MHSPVPPPGSLHDARDAYTSGAHAGALTRETKSIKFEWIRSVLTAVSYDHLSRDDKGVVREYIRSVTGYSRAHVERSIAAYRLSGIRELRPVQALRLPQIAEKAVALVRRTELQWTMGVAVLTLFVLILGRSAVGPSASLLSLPVPARGPQAALTRVAGFTAEHIVTPSITIPAFTAEPTIIAIGELSFSRITSTSQVRRDERRLARQGITGAVVAFDPLPAEQSTAQLALVSQVQSADTQRSLQDRIRERALQRGGVRSSAVTDAPSQYSTSASPSRTYGPLVEEQGALEFALMTQLQSIEAQRALQERVRDRAAQRQLTRVNPAAPAAPVGSVTGVPTQSSAGTGRPTEGGVQRGELTASQLIRVMGPAEEGQVIMIVNGKAVWRDLPSLIERVIQGTEGRETGVGRAPRGGGGHASGDDGGRSGRGGGSTITDANDGKIESHDHQNDAGGGVLDINGATNGILRVEQGGTGFGNFATGDLLVGTAGGGLDKLAKGTNGQTLTVSNGTLSWGSAGAGDLTQANADLRYVSVAGDTMTGALAIFSTLAASGAVRFDSDLTLNDDQTASDTILTFGSDSTNETLKFLNNEDRFEFSDDIRATGSIQGSGTLIIDGATVFKSTIRLNGVTYTFPTSDGTSSGKVLKTNGAGQLVWTSDADTGASGITQTSGDARYVNVSGDTMTGALSVKRTAGTSTGNTLVIDTKGLIYDASNKRVGIGTATPRTALEVLGTISGSMLNIRDNITASGTLVIQGATTLKSTLGVTGNISGNADLSLNADQTAADTILTFGSDTTNETLKFLNNEDRFEFSDDLNVTGGLYASGAAIIGGSQLVKGDLTINSDAGAADTVLTFGSDSTNETLKFLNNEDRFEASDDFRATGSLQASGALIIDGAATFKSTIRLNGVTYTFPTSDGTASGKVLKTNSAGVLSWSADIDTDTNTTYGAGQGLTLNGTTFSLTNTFSGTSLEIMGTASGRILHAQDELRSSGSLVVEGAFSLNSYQDFFEIAAPASPSASTLRLWAESQNGFGQLHFKNSSGLDYQLGRDNIMTVRNTTGVAITKGQWVYISGSTGVVPNVALAKADSASTMPAMGVAVADISNNSFGQIMTMGDVQGLDTSAFNDGDVLYISASTAGAVTTTRATGTSMDQRVGVVVKDSVGAGIIAVMIGGEFDPSTTQTFSNKTFSGNTEFIGTASGRILHAQDELHSSGSLVVEGATVLNSTIRLNGVTYTFPTSDGSATGKVLKTNSAGVLSWSSDIGSFATIQTEADTRYVNVSGDTMTGALTILKAAGTSTGNTLVIDTKGLIYDASNKRVGIGTATPRTALEVLGTISGSTLNIRDNITASGTLVIQGASTLKSTLAVTGNITANADLSLNADQTAADTVLTFGSDSTNETLKFLNLEDRFEFSDDLNATGGLYASGAMIIGGAGLVKGDFTINSDQTAADTVLTFGSDTTNETVKFLNNEDRFEVSDDFRATGSIQGSGTLIVDGAATFKSTIRLNGVTYTFPTSDGSATGKVLKTDSAGNLSWSTDNNSGGMGFAEAASYFVDDTGDTMSGALSILKTAGTSTGNTLIVDTKGLVYDASNKRVGIGTATPRTALEVLGTISGSTLNVRDNITASGTLVIQGATVLKSTVNIPVASTTNTQFGAGATGFRVDTTNGQFILGNGGYIDGYYGELQLTGGTDSVSGTKRIITAAGKNLSLMPGGYVGISTTNPKARLTVVGSGAFTQTVSGSALTFMGGDSYILGNLGIGKSGTPTTKLEVLGTISGSMLNIRDNITASGTLVVDGVLKTKSDLTINADAGAADTVLTFGSDTTNETLKFLNNEDRFEFSDDLNVTGGLYSSGALIVASDSKFKGDLTINSDAGAADTILTFGSDSANETLKFLNNEDRFEFSDDLNVTGGLYASGALIIGSASIFKNTLEVQSTLSGAALTIMAGDSSFLGELGIGTSAVEARLEVAGTMSGRALQLTGTGAKPLIATDISNGRLGFGTTAPTQFITMSGGVFEHLAGATPALLSGADVTSNVTAVVVESKYAYIGHGSISGNDFRVVDIGNPRKPSTVGGVDLGSGTLSIAVAGDYAYVGHGIRTGDDFRVIDISNASNPFTASGIDIGANTNAVEIAGKNAYLGTNAAGAEFQIVDVSNPYHPLQKKLIDIPGKVYSLAIEGHYAYVGYTQPSSNGSGVSVYDVSKIQNPSLVDTITIGDSATVRALQAEGKFLYVGNTTLAGTCSGSTVAGCEFRIYNLTDTTNAVPLGGYDIGAAVNSIDIAGRYAYIGIDTVAGKDFRIIDISNPALPVEIGGVDMTTDVYAVAVAGKYAYLGHGSLAGNDMRIVDLAGIDAPTATIGAIAANSLSIAGDASIGNDLTVGNSITVGVGGIQSMGPVGIFTGTGSFTGAIIHNRSERGPVLALDSMTGSDIGAHILFGYMGNFDTNLYRSSGSTLRSDDKLLLTATNAENRELIRLDTEESTGSQNVFIIVSDVTSGENTVFRINASGATFSDQPYTSGGADYAEWFYSSDTDLERGEVVCIDVTSPNTVERCTQTADGNVMGIISSNPAFIGNSLTGAEGLPVPGYFLVGLIGQVPARVTTENGPIRPGDSLTSASIPGFARRADSGESTVGVALEGLETGDGIVNVLISRRNQSLTVEAVEQHVLETIAAMEIDDEVQIMVTKALSEEGFNERISEAVRTQVGMLDLASQIEAMIDAKLSGQSGSTIASPIAISAEGVQIATDLTALSDVEFQSALRVVGPMTLSGSLSALGGISTTSLQVAKTIEVMGDGRIGGDLHVDGTLIVDEIIATKPLFVDGDLNFGGSLHGAALFLNSGAYLKGDLEVEGDLKVHGALDIDNLEISGAVDVGTLLVRDAVHVLGPITIDGLATFFGDVDVRGDLIVSNRQAGYASIPKTGTAVTVLFGTGGFRTLPIVSASPDVPVLFAVSRATMTGFTIRLGLPAPEAVTFSWIALATSEPLTAEGMSTGNTALIPFPVDSHGVPLSSNAIWNACIRNLTILDEQGQPLSCGRYHQDSTWTHPDLGISFVWNTDSEPPILTLPDGYEVVVTETDDEGADEEEIQTGTGALLEEPAVGSGTDAIEEEPLSGTGSDIVTSSGSDALSPEPEAGSGSAEGGNSVDSGSGTQTPLNPIPETASGAVEQGSGGTVE